MTPDGCAPACGRISRISRSGSRGRLLAWLADSLPDRTLADVSRQVLIGRDEFVPSRLAVAALTPAEVGREIFGVDLPPGPVEGDLVQGHAPDLDDQDGLVAVGGQRELGDLVERRHTLPLPIGFVGFPGRQQQPPWRLPRLHAPGALEVTVLDVHAQL